ncbi:iron-containing alcohol dehydrogenase family protein [Natrarchaeobius sp. A-rgal3]|uniref:iron-containing alcohol dehydrogenase family protein n=1 Tax=Natrarchaeobius versutus TaxID=1679078 RepID=UPI00351030A0
MNGNSFTFEYQPGAIHHGPGVVADVQATLEARGLSRALVVTDETLAEVPVVIDPVREGIGDALVDVFDGVTPEKYLRDAYEGAKLVREEDVDALVALGGGSSLDISKQISVLAGHDRPLEEVTEEILDREEMILPDEEASLTDIFAIPTTLPGADLSQVAGVKLSLEPGDASKAEIPSAGVSDRRLMPTAVFHDLELFSTTPDHILATSAMNGFDKGIEMLYSRHHTPVTDATATRGVRLLQSSLPSITDDETSEDDLSTVLQGIALAQYGLSTPNEYHASVIHSFGHALSRSYQIQQGASHAIAAPYALAYLFDNVDGRRDLLAEALGVDDEGASDEETADAIVSAVESTRDALELPSSLRTVDGAERDHFSDLAQAVVDDPFMDAAPRDLEPDAEEIEDVFDRMW